MAPSLEDAECPHAFVREREGPALVAVLRTPEAALIEAAWRADEVDILVRVPAGSDRRARLPVATGCA